MTTMIILEKAMKLVDNGEPWTVATERGDGWLYYFDGETLHGGSYRTTLEELMSRKCVEVYERPERKHWSEADKKDHPYMELEAGLAFIVTGRENGKI